MTLKTFPFILSALLFFQNSISSKLFAQTESPISKELEDKIKQVENNLVPWVKDQDSLKFSIKDRMAKYNINGLSIVVIKNYKIEWAKGYGWANVEKKQPVTTKTLFQAGSISKSLNGVGILKLVQDKKLDLNVDINNYLITWKFPYDSLSKNKKITIANLLSHTAGLSVHGYGGYMKDENIPSIYDILDGRKPANSEAVHSIYEPGKISEYSGGGITISQLILTDITRKKYEDYMWSQVLKPMGMTQSFFNQPPPESKKNLLASGYLSDGKEMVEGNYNIYPEKAAAGLWTNPTDLGKYVIETQLSLKGKSNKVLSQEITKLRLTPYIDHESGLGVFIKQKGDEKYFTHSGGTKGFICEYIGSFENGNGVVVMTNSGNPGISTEIINSVSIVYEWTGFYNPTIKKTISLSDAVMQKYIGEYMWHGKSVSILKEQNELWLNAPVKSKLYFTSDYDFYINEKEMDYKFIEDSNGFVNGFNDTNNIKVEKIK
ncbi:CubicO group peptidase (beta-lactamase class C family) [Chitinophaga niastensis]|uniref:CubicO group peptidase (Beta-lactamase class C family) n=1 Tax=Chitinophaga niastensis TaxID=536980 RepID=A0A2P8HDD7_CHINA|nr:serine hydrolase domain-containing protein [Chitinophaga niastensis]PSL44243.1 CubicO group peptidase (beta-lactamase class C family) [Chitinophaga niastensis]